MYKLFTYKIENVSIVVYHSPQPECTENSHLVLGYKEAVAEWLCYPYAILSERLGNHHLHFETDNPLPDRSGIIQVATKDAFLNFLEAHPEKEELITPPYVTTAHHSIKMVEDWVDSLLNEAEATQTQTEYCDIASQDEIKWLKFDYYNPNYQNTFYGRYKFEGDDSALLVSLPGYQSEWNDISPYLQEGYSVLQLCPLGYNTPYGFDESKKVRGAWPVLHDTVLDPRKIIGYRQWFLECVLAIKALRKYNQKLVFLGTSQGGGTALVLSSIFRNDTLACAAEMPFLIGFSGMNYDLVRAFVAQPNIEIYDFIAREKLYVVDPLTHCHRLSAPTLLIAGEKDTECPKEDIELLFQKLNCSKKHYIELRGKKHGYTKEFEKIAKDWIKSFT